MTSEDDNKSVEVILADGDDDEAEVAYDKGATQLFLAIENAKWRDALEIAERSPEQIRIWVRSMGTENTTFGWALWRRLPIHEVNSLSFFSWLVNNQYFEYSNHGFLHFLLIWDTLTVCFETSGMQTTAPCLAHLASLVKVS